MSKDNKPAEKEIILEVSENIKIVREDNENLGVHRLEELYNPREKEYRKSWQRKGYYSTILQCLSNITRQELLVDSKEINGIEDYIKQVEKSNKIVEKLIQSVK